MNKKNITLILAGIFLASLRLVINIGSVQIDLANDIIAFILIAIGATPLAIRNKFFKKGRTVSYIGLVAAVAAQIMNCMNWGEEAATYHSITYGMTVVFAIFFSYYFTTGLVTEAKFQEKAAATNSLNITWTVLAAAVFIHFMAFPSVVNTAAIVVEAIVGICGIYYVSTTLTACKQLYMEGLPTKHMNI